MFTTVLAKIISFFLSAVMTISFPINLLTGKVHEKIARAEDGCALSFAVISDTHIDERTSFFSNSMLKTGLTDMESAPDRLDALVLDGDITNHGYVKQWEIVAETMSQYNPAASTYLVIGNHDTWGPNEENFADPVNGVLPTFAKYNKEITGRELDKMYYSDVVNGYCFIMLGSEGDHTYATLSDEQLAWFAGEMEKAAQTKLPIFVFCHQSLNQTHGLPENWDLSRPHEPETGGIGAQSAAVAEILMQYDNVFYCSGHIHAGFKNEGSKIGVKYASVEYLQNNNGNRITLINTPCFTNPDFTRGGHIPNGCGWVIEAYADKVLLRARNFSAGTWLTKYDVAVPLADAAA